MKLRRILSVLTLVPLVALIIPLRLQHHSNLVPKSLQGVASAEEPALDSLSRSPHMIAAPGFIEPISGTIAISASAAGRLTYLNTEEGEQLKAGQIIGETENGDLQAELAAAQAELKIRENELARINAGAREQERGEAQAALREADSTATFARVQLGRQKELVDRAISRAALDQARSDYDAAEARRTALAEKLSLVEAPPRAEDIAIAEAQVEAAKAHISAEQAMLQKTTIRSPIDAMVLRRYQKAGEMMSILPPTLIVEIGDVSRLRVRAQVDEADVGRVAVGQEVWISADAYGNRRFRGRVSRVGVIMGPKNFRTDRPGERMDTKLLEAMIDLEPEVKMPVGLRVDVTFTQQLTEAHEFATGSATVGPD